MTATMPTSTPTTAGFDLADIQGNILRGYRQTDGRHFVLAVGNTGGARECLAALVSGDEAIAPQVTTAEHWGDEKPAYCLNVALTVSGLAALGVAPSTIALFPEPFRDGAAARAAALGDTGPADPSTWVMGGPGNPPAHILISLYTTESRNPVRDALSAQLRTLFARCGLIEVWTQDVASFPHGKVHFGYRDGIGQPRIEGAPAKSIPDMQPASKAGDFLLGRDYENQYRGNYLGGVPHELGDNATYSVFRVIRQDVAAFESFIALAGKRANMEPEMIAAKLMGRWRNGVPLTLAPESDEPSNRKLGFRDLDKFDYAPSDEYPEYFDDDVGRRCPVGSHIRRLNPRSGMTMGKPHTRRIIRRGIPYGPDFDPAKPDDAERGLTGWFICGDIAMQYEFIVGTWANGDFSAAGLRGTRESILGAHPPEGGSFVLRTNDNRDPIILDGIPRLTATRACLYCLVPGIGGIRFLAGVRGA
jgi:deferrochelatase/peroxidase EfeB